MPFGAHTRICPACTSIIPDPPAAPACSGCGRLACLHHTQWEPVVKWHLIAMFIRSMLMPWQSEQDLWETLLRGRLVPDGSRPNPNGTHLTASTPTADLYPIIVEQAHHWKAAGSPIFAPDPAPAQSQPLARSIA
jgi:hypothetical protein